MSDLYLKNALIVTEQEQFEGGVVITDGKIAQLVTAEPNLSIDATTVIDLTGKVLIPGLIDGHVHFNEPGRTEWEGYRTGTMAAAAGGITTVIDMPLNATPPTINLVELEHKRAAVANQAVVDYAHWGGVVDNNLGKLAAMHAAGVVGFKGFMSESGVDFARIDNDVLTAALNQTSSAHTIVAVHAEDEQSTTLLAKKLQQQGRTDRSAWTESRPAFTEVEAIQQAARCAEETGGTLHIVHASTGDAVQTVVDAKDRGVRITVETCPHYLFLDADDFIALGPIAKCAPPLSSRDEVNALWTQLLSGNIDVIGSDHSPCTLDLKRKGEHNIWEAWGGISGIQSMLPIMLTEGVHKRNWPLSKLVATMCTNPARLYGLYPQKGTLSLGSDADLVVLDLDAEWTLTADQLFYKNKHSPYIDCTFTGRVEQTIVRGTTVYNQGKILVEPGFGQLLKRRSLS